MMDNELLCGFRTVQFNSGRTEAQNGPVNGFVASRNCQNQNPDELKSQTKWGELNQA